MRRLMVWIVVLVPWLGSTCAHRNIEGDWQGALKVGPQELRMILQITKANSGAWNATLYSIDQGADALPVNSVTLQGSNIKFTVDAVHGTFEGKLSTAGDSIMGTWTQGRPLPLELRRATKETAWQRDPSSHTVRFITVDDNVKLEVLDWGGSGRPLVLLAGLGNTAHIFDTFAPKLASTYHVYGITRRGFGASTAPADANGNYSADRLGDDVLAVVDSLKINRPVLVGHSIAGEELSSIATRHPERVAGLVYLDAGYSYAYYDRSRGDITLDSLELREKLEQVILGGWGGKDPNVVEELLTILPQVEKELREQQKAQQALPKQPPQSGPIPIAPRAILLGERKYTDIPSPILAIFALPHDLGPAFQDNPAARAALHARDVVVTGAQAKAFETGVPSAHVVRLANASHFVFASNEADVLREMKAFIDGLPSTR